jgi:hypothetical protein
MPVAAPVIMGVASVAGAAISAKGQKDAAKAAASGAAYKPYDLSIGGNQIVDVNEKTGRANFFDPALNTLRQQILNNPGLADGFGFNAQDPRASTARWAYTRGQANYQTDFDRAYAALNPNTPNLDPFQNRAGIQGGLLWDRIGSLNGMYMGGMTGTSQGMNSLLMAGRNDLANADAQAMQRYAMLEQMARPMENNAAFRTINNLYNTGRLGSTGGAEQMRVLNESLSNAALGRQNAALDYGQNMRMTATNMLNSGFGQFNSLGAGMQSMASTADAVSTGIGQRLAVNDTYRTNRAMDKMKLTESLFGFGSGLQTDAFNYSNAQYGLLSNMDADARSWLALSGNFGGQQAQAGAAAGQLMLQGGAGAKTALAEAGVSAAANIAKAWIESRQTTTPKPTTGTITV